MLQLCAAKDNAQKKATLHPSVILDQSSLSSILNGKPQILSLVWTENYNIGIIRQVKYNQMQLVQFV